jgi:hypothetical protein
VQADRELQTRGREDPALSVSRECAIPSRCRFGAKPERLPDERGHFRCSSTAVACSDAAETLANKQIAGGRRISRLRLGW